jgi:hypothetical protein
MFRVSDAPLKDLYDNIAAGALHNSSERYDAPKCHEETRVAVQEDIFSWITDGDKDAEPKRILWLTGPAGSGKTAIMGSVAETCQRQEQLAASFFFSSSSGSPDRQSKRCFVSTLAYQLRQGKDLEKLISPRILASIEKDPAIFKKRLDEQMEVLILGPLRASQGKYAGFTAPRIIIIDGLDECDAQPEQGSSSTRTKEQDQIEILSVLLHASKDPSFPFKIIIASRPESWIRRFFSAPSAVQGPAAEIFLDNKYSPNEDIALFLRSKFAEIRRRYDHLPASWPSEEIIALLVVNSSGQFVYAATVMRFIETPSQPPQAQLDVVLSLRARDEEDPFGPLDALYTKILSSSPNPKVTFLWLRAYRFFSGGRIPWHPCASFFNSLCESSAGEAYLTLGSLPSLIRFPQIPDHSDMYHFYHKSFLDFLEDPNRCQTFRHLGDKPVLEWICSRFGRSLMGMLLPSLPTSLCTYKSCLVANGPEVLVNEKVCENFIELFLRLWDPWVERGDPSMVIPDEVLSNCDPEWWAGFMAGNHTEDIEDRDLHYKNRQHFCRDLYVMVHKNVSAPALSLAPSCAQGFVLVPSALSMQPVL